MKPQEISPITNKPDEIKGSHRTVIMNWKKICVRFKHKSKLGKSIETIYISPEVTENSLTKTTIEKIINSKGKNATTTKNRNKKRRKYELKIEQLKIQKRKQKPNKEKWRHNQTHKAH